MLQPKKPVKVVEKKTTVTTKPKKSKSASERIGDLTLRDVKDAGETALNLSTLGGYGVAKKKVKELMNKKSGGTMKKAKSGFAALAPPYDKATFADKIAGAKKNAGKAKSGAKMAKQAAVAIAMKKAGKKPKKAMMGTMAKPMMKSGGKMAKCKYGCK